jgi:cytochrome b561
MEIYPFFKSLHSGFRYIVFLLLLAAIIQSIIGLRSKNPFSKADKQISLFALISAHTQLLIGLVLLFISPYVNFKHPTVNAHTRYFTMEHWVMMLIAIALITVGYSKAKKQLMPKAKHKTIAIFYSIALLVIIGSILAGHLPLLGSAK